MTALLSDSNQYTERQDKVIPVTNILSASVLYRHMCMSCKNYGITLAKQELKIGKPLMHHIDSWRFGNAVPKVICQPVCQSIQHSLIIGKNTVYSSNTQNNLCVENLLLVTR